MASSNAAPKTASRKLKYKELIERGSKVSK